MTAPPTASQGSETLPLGEPTSAYVHIPFCARRCGYCNFTVVAGRDDLQASYLDALERELSQLGTPRPVNTLFVGGGTPTQLQPEHLARLLELLERWHPRTAVEGYEYTFEANPIHVDAALSRTLRAGGVTRLSLGGQSFRPETLRLLERDHDPDQVLRAAEAAASAGLATSLDLIFGVPGTTLADWEADLAAALALPLDHVSTYGLTFEKGTTFWGRRLKGALESLDEEAERAMYAHGIDRLTAAGFEHYEVSNFARHGKRCRHNEVYWAGAPYFAAGAGASRYLHGRRETNHRSTTTYIRKILAGESPVDFHEELAPEDRAREAGVLALRRREGLHIPTFAARFGFDLELLWADALPRLIDWGLLEWTAPADAPSRRLRLTRDGLMISDSIWPYLLRE